MAHDQHDQSQDGQGSSWYQQAQGDQATPNYPRIEGSSGTEQSYTTTASSSGPVVYGRSWSNEASGYAPHAGPSPYGRSWSDEGPFHIPQQPLPYHHQYQQSAALEHHVVGNGVGRPGTVGGSQLTHAGHYTLPQTYANPYQYVNVC
jgi:hypothetical protein